MSISGCPLMLCHCRSSDITASAFLQGPDIPSDSQRMSTLAASTYRLRESHRMTYAGVGQGHEENHRPLGLEVTLTVL